MVARGGRLQQGGIGYLFMLLAVFLLSLGLGKTMDVYTTSVQREREAELIDVGTLYREAIKDYYLSAPDGQHRYPQRIDDLLKDSRHLVARRYLRQLYVDPMTSQALTPLLAPQGGIWGVASSSTRTPLRTSPSAAVTITPAQTYKEWQFIYPGGG